jgi:hypothetical protein
MTDSRERGPPTAILVSNGRAFPCPEDAELIVKSKTSRAFSARDLEVGDCILDATFFFSASVAAAKPIVDVELVPESLVISPPVDAAPSASSPTRHVS